MADGHKFSAVRLASEPETSRPVEIRNFYLRHLHLAPPLGVTPSQFRRDLLHHKTRVPMLSCGVVSDIHLDVLIQYRAYRLETDGRIDRQTDTR